MNFPRFLNPAEVAAYAKKLNNQQLRMMRDGMIRLVNEPELRKQMTKHAAKNNQQYGDNAILETCTNDIPIFTAEMERRGLK